MFITPAAGLQLAIWRRNEQTAVEIWLQMPPSTNTLKKKADNNSLDDKAKWEHTH